MGEIADMMLDGTMCECCGEFMEDIIAGGDAPGFPRYCSAQCAKGRGASDELVAAGKDWNRHSAMDNEWRTNCPTCGKRVAKIGLEQHIAAKHVP